MYTHKQFLHLMICWSLWLNPQIQLTPLVTASGAGGDAVSSSSSSSSSEELSIKAFLFLAAEADTRGSDEARFVPRPPRPRPRGRPPRPPRPRPRGRPAGSADCDWSPAGPGPGPVQSRSKSSSLSVSLLIMVAETLSRENAASTFKFFLTTALHLPRRAPPTPPLPPLGGGGDVVVHLVLVAGLLLVLENVEVLEVALLASLATNDVI